MRLNRPVAVPRTAKGGAISSVRAIAVPPVKISRPAGYSEYPNVVTSSDVTIGSSIVPTVTPVVTEAGATITSSVALSATRAVSDTGSSISSVIQAVITRLVTSGDVSIASTVTASIGPAISSTGAAIGSSVATIAVPQVTSTGATITSSAILSTLRLVSSVDVSIGSSVVVRAGPAITSAGVQRGTLDTFTRTVSANGWGAEELNGAAWTSGAGLAAYSVDGTRGLTGPMAASAVKRLYVVVGLTDVLVVADITFDSVATGGAILGNLWARLQSDHTNGYNLKVGYEAAGSVTLTLQLFSGGTATILGGGAKVIQPASANPQASLPTWRTQLLVSGTNLYGRTWRIGVDSIPTWQTAASDATWASGDVGVQGSIGVGATNTPTVAFDNFRGDLDFIANLQVTPGITSSGTTIGSSVRITAAPLISSTGATISDSVSSAFTPASTNFPRPVSDVGATIGSTVAITAAPVVTSSDVTIGSAVALTAARPVISTGSTITSTAAITATPVVSSTGATITSSVGPQQISRAVADTGSSITSSVAITATPVISSTGATITSNATVTIPRPVSGTGATIASSVTPTVTPVLTSAGSTIASSVAIQAAPVVSSSGATITSSVGVTVGPAGIASVGTTITSSATITATRVVASTGASVTSSVSITAAPLISSTGAMISDSASSAHVATATSAGATIGSSVTIQVSLQRAITSTGATITDTPGRSIALTIPISDTGATITSSASAIPPVFATDVGVQGALVLDTFQRSTSSELGTADSGQAWINNFTFVGTGWTFSVNGATAFAQTNVSNQAQSRGLADFQVDGDWYADVQYSSHASGGLQEQGIILCHDAATGVYFRAQIREAASGVVSLAVESSRSAGTLIGSRVTLPGADPVTNPYTIHVQKRGRLLRANAYQAGMSEPAGWMTSGQADAVLDPIGGGQPGWRVNAGSGNSNFAAFTLDNVNFAASGVGSAIGVSVTRPITTSGATIGSTAGVTPPPGTATDVGATIGSSVAITAAPVITTTGVAIGSTITRVVGRQVSSVGATITSGFGKATTVSVVDAGTQADSVIDSFERVVPSELGVADSGQAWGDVLGFVGIGWTFSVSGGTAIGVPTSANQAQSRGQHVTQTDGEWRMDVQFSSHAAGGLQEQGHYISAGASYIRIMLREAATGAVSLRIESSIGSALLASVAMPGADPVAGAYTIHVVRLGNRITANAYPAGSAEPSGWMAAGVAGVGDSTGGTSGWRVSTGAGNTNLATYRMDNYLDIVPGVNSGIASTRLRAITDSVTVGSSVSGISSRPGAVSSTGATITSSMSVQAVHTRFPASSGASVDSSVGLHRVLGKTALSAGATIDSFVTLSSTGARQVASTGAAITSTAHSTVTRRITSSGATIASSVTLSANIYGIAITSHAFSGLYPSVLLYPSTTLYPSYSMSDSVTATVVRTTLITTGATAAVPLAGATATRNRTGSLTATTRHNPAVTSCTLRGTGRTSVTVLRGTTTSVSPRPGQTSVRPLVGVTEALV